MAIRPATCYHYYLWWYFLVQRFGRQHDVCSDVFSHSNKYVSCFCDKLAETFWLRQAKLSVLCKILQCKVVKSNLSSSNSTTTINTSKANVSRSVLTPERYARKSMRAYRFWTFHLTPTYFQKALIFLTVSVYIPRDWNIPNYNCNCFYRSVKPTQMEKRGNEKYALKNVWP
jgi:hypothetical protein